MFPTSTESFGPNQDVHGSAYVCPFTHDYLPQKGHISEQDLQKLEDSIVNASSDPFSILHTICDRFGIAPKSTSIDTQTPSNPSLFSHLLSALFTVGYSLLITSFFLLPLSSIQSSSSQYLPNTVNFQLLPLFTTILQRHPLSLPNFLSSPLWLSLPSTLIASPQSPSTLQTQPQPSPPNEPQREEQSHLRPVLSFINSTLLLCLSSSPPTPIPNKTLLSSSLSTFSSHPDPLVKVHSGSALLTLNQLDGGTDETSMSVDELVAQRDTLRAQIEEKNEEIARLMEIQRQMDETIRSRDQIIAEKDDSLKQKDFMLTQQATTIAELTKMLGEFESMEKRLNDELGKTHSKMVAVEAQLTEAAKDVKWIRGFAHSDNAITVWDPKHFRREGRRITSLVMDYKSCFSDEITRGMWRLSIRCNKYDLHSLFFSFHLPSVWCHCLFVS
ncbi:hypothetical protein BLNAU_9574 [Blattamonas nauphoetae]|uniref:Uncharacterized protein n=1 Tax=Blattamonas nauphoetae TaxID=2049346 RepID=A0ABQ9XVM3_9EUKA|nr:hypothetical protein BLNAU_9574 [Blattamonas nauphoetae]